MNKTEQRSAAAIFLLYAIYFIALFKITLYRDANTQPGSVSLVPFLTISDYIASIVNGNRIIAIFNLLGNLVLFFPLGFLTPATIPIMKKIGRIILVSLILSVVIEVCQFVYSCGAADVDDLILNVLGGGIGYGAYAFVSRFSRSKKQVLMIGIVSIALTCTGYYARNSFQFILPLPPMSAENDEHPAEHPEIQKRQESAFSQSPPLAKVTLNSSNAIALRLDKGGSKVLFDKGGSERIYPASMTKIMTALIALERINNLESIVTLNEKMFAEIYSSNSSTAGFLPGERVRAIDLLYGLI